MLEHILNCLICGTVILGLISCGNEKIESIDINDIQIPIIEKSSDKEKEPEVPKIVETPLSMNVVYQNPEYPNGCELASLCAVLQYHGFSTSIDELMQYFSMDDIIYRNGRRYGPDPNKSYPNRPDQTNGWYCYEGPIAKTAMKYFKSLDDPSLDFTASASMLYTLDDLFQEYVQYGNPAIIWATTNYNDPIKSPNYSWYLSDGSLFVPYANIHCIVLLGIDGEHSVCTVMDPLLGIINVDYSKLSNCYSAVGSRAVVIERITHVK